MLDDVLATIEDPRKGLPDEVFDFVRRVTPLVNVDLLIQRNGESLLAWREDEYARGWHVMGGIVRFREPLKKRIDAVAAQEIGVAVESEASPCAMNEVRSMERAHFISLLYRCRLMEAIDASRMFSGNGKPDNGALAWIRGVPADLYPDQRFYADWLDGTRL